MSNPPSISFDFELHPRQMEAFNSIATEILYGGAAGGGKALALDTRIRTTVGWKFFGELEPSDYVYGIDGKPTKVVDVTPFMYNHKCFSVNFVGGYNIVADAEHTWKIKYNGEDELITTEDLKILSDYNKIDIQGLNKIHIIESIDLVSSVPVRCIQVEREDGMFLVGHHEVPTHNSHLMRVVGITCCLESPGLQVYIFRRQSTDLEQNHMEGPTGFPMLLGRLVDAGYVKIVGSPKIVISFKNGPTGDFVGGSKIFLCHCKDEKDKWNYRGAEIHVLLIDELTSFTESQFRFLRGRVRLGAYRPPANVRPGKYPFVLAGSNPGDIGHYHVKHAFIDGHVPMEIWRTPKKEGGLLRQYIPAKLEDNPTLMTNDPDYGDRLEGLGDPALVKAMREGDWDTFQGQAFPFSQNFHVVSPCPIPAHAQLYMTFDWGYGAPFSVGWWWVDADGRVFRFSEWYGWNGQPNQGMRMTDSEIASGIKEREDRLGIAARSIIRLAGPDCFSKKPDYLGGGQGPSTSEMFARQGVNLSPGDADRKKKIRQFHERLRVPKDGSAPMLQVYSTCTQFIRTIPTLVLDERNVEDLATNLEDHIYDEACHICMARPIEMVEPSSQKTKVQRMIEKWEEPETSDTLSVAGVYSEHYGEEERGVVNSIHGDDNPLGAINETWSFLQ